MDLVGEAFVANPLEDGQELNKELVGVQTRLLNTARKSPERRRLKDESERLQRVIDGEVAQIRRPDVSCDTEVE